jgi:hypothetical protein
MDEIYLADRKHEDWRTALIVCTLANCFRGKDSKVLQPSDVMPWLKPQPRDPGRQTPEQMRKVMEKITLELGGVVKPRHQPLA